MKIWIDEGPPGYNADKYTPTRSDTGLIDPQLIRDIPGANNEHRLFQQSPSGRMTAQEWLRFKADLRAHGMKYAITIFKEKDGTVHIGEGNHRLHAALEMHLDTVPVEIRYFGNSQRDGLVVG